MASLPKWYVDFPTYQYEEDIQQVAKDAGLTIVDSAFQGENKQCKDAPKLSVIGAKPKAKAKTKRKGKDDGSK